MGYSRFLLPGTDESNALAVADRLCAQVRQCKVRMGSDLWDLTASIGVAHCTCGSPRHGHHAERRGRLACGRGKGGDAVCVGQAIQEPASATIL